MSFILDALKKSESDRQRQSGPALFEVKLAPPRTGLPAWAIAIAALLLVNLGVVMWMLLRHSATRAPDAPRGVAERVSADGAASAHQAVAAAASGQALPTPAAALPAVAAAPSPPPLTAAPAAMPPPASASAAAQGSEPPAPANPDDFAPASEPAAPSMLGPHVHRGTADGVPLYQDAAASLEARLPQLRLDLHVFASRAQDRFVMLNMHKLHEGDSTPEGVRVESITPEGAVLSYNGSRFLLPR